MGALRAGFHGTVGQPSAQVIDGSLKFDSGATNYLKRTPSVAGNRRTFTISFWVKRSKVSANEPGILSTYDGVSGPSFTCYFNSSDKLRVYDHNSGYRLNLITTQVFRDCNSWYHIVISIDTTASDKTKLYVNGIRVTEFSTELYPGDINLDWNTATAHNIGRHVNAYDGNISNFYSIDGQALGPEYFGFTDPLTNTWRPKKFEGPTSPNNGTTWSSYLTIAANDTIQTPENAFDNDSFGTYAERSSGQNDPAIYTFSPSSTIRANSSIRVSAYAASGSTLNHIKVTYNNGVQVTKTAGDLGLGNPGDQAWFDLSSYINFPADISSIEYSSHGGGGRLSGIEIDGILLIDGLNDPKGFGTNGFYLPMDGNSPIGEDKSGIVTPNNGSIWSASLTSSTGFRSAEPKTNAFDGNTSSICSASGSGTITFTSPVTFASNSTIRVFLHGGNHTVTVNGGDGQTISAGSFQKVTYSNPGNSTFVMTFYRGGNNDTGVRAIEINGVLLVDGLKGNSWTPVNFGGSNTIEKATGALPILNTVSGGNVATVGVRTDATVAAGVGTCVLALPLVGNANDVSNQINSGSTTKAVTVTNAGASNVSNFYGGSYYFDGADDYVTVTDSSEITLGAGDFTIEYWQNLNSVSGNPTLFDKGYSGSGIDANGWVIQYSSNKKKFYVGSTAVLTDTDDTPTGKWIHWAFVRSSGKLKMYKDGIEKVSASNSTDLSHATDLGIGANLEAGSGFTVGQGAIDGYLSDIRIYKGVAKYTENFIPASTNPDILPDTPSGVSGGSKLTKVTEGAVSIPGTTDYLVIPDSTDLELGSDDFTIEAYINPTGIPGDSGYNCIFAKGESLQCYFMSDGSLTLFASTNYSVDGYDIINNNGLSADSISLNRWHHLAVCRSGDTWKVFLDGIEGYSGTHSGSIEDNAYGFSIGDYAPSAGSYDYQGFISNFRVVKGTALYTSDFTPPTEPLTNVTNTKLLCAQSTSEHKDITGRLYKSGTLYTTKADIIANATPLEGGETLNSDYFYYVPSGNELTGQQVFSVNGAITNGDSLNRWSWIRHDGTNWLAITGGYNPGQFDEFYFGADDVTYNLDPGRGFYALTIIGGTSPSQHSGTAPTLKKQFTLDGAVKPGTITANGDAAATNFNPFNTDINTVRGQETGYPTWNPLRVSDQTLSNNNMTTTGTSGNVLGSMFTPTSGKFYWEVTAGSNYTMTGIQRENNYDMSFPGNSAGQIALYLNNAMGSGQLYIANSITSSWGGGVAGDVIGVALDMDNNKVYFYNNGRGLGSGGITGTPEAVDVPTGGGYTANCRSGSGTSDGPSTINFGQKPFKFPPPDGFQPLNSANVRPETVIARPDQYVGITTWTGNSTDDRQINTGFRPDLVWTKRRDSALDHIIFDSVRGKGSELYSNQNYAEGTGSTKIGGFNDFGFTVNNNSAINQTGNWVSWNWKAGGNKNTFNVDDVGYATAAAAGLDAGVVTPSAASVGTKQGFSIVKYNGTADQTCAHGLTQAPEFIIEKEIGQTSAWTVQTTVIDGSLDYLYLNTLAGASDYSIDAPTSTVFDIGRSNECIAYLWHSVPGFSKFGSFTTNNSSTEYVHLGFKPAILWIKRTGKGSTTNLTTYGSWYVNNSEMSPINPASYEEVLWLNRDYAKGKRGNNDSSGTYLNVDFLSDGFRLRGSANAEIGQPNDINIYCAWAESPAINLYGATSNAR